MSDWNELLSNRREAVELDDAAGQVERVVIRCPRCGDSAVGHFRMDSDWGYGGDWTKVNTADNYAEHELHKFIINERPDIECNVCCQCGNCF